MNTDLPNWEKPLRKVIVKIGLERINTQKGIIVEVLLDNKIIGLVISSEFIRKQVFKLKKMKRLYMWMGYSTIKD